jgi:shikimate dehydrogenase
MTDSYGVFGFPVSHSLSPFIHGMFARQTGQDLVYRLYEVPPGRFRGDVLEFFRQGGRGINVTVPHKLAAVDIVNELTPRAQLANAVNTIALRDEALLGDNTDGIGLVVDLVRNMGLRLAERRILILGAGGAARGVLGPLLDLRPRLVTIANRTRERALELAHEFTDLGPVTGGSLEQLEGQRFDLVVNATSASLKGDVPAVPRGVIDGSTTCYDMAYGGGADTAFTTWARQQGAVRTTQGLGMLVEQAAEAFYLWRGVKPETASVLEALRARGGAH